MPRPTKTSKVFFFKPNDPQDLGRKSCQVTFSLSLELRDTVVEPILLKGGNTTTSIMALHALSQTTEVSKSPKTAPNQLHKLATPKQMINILQSSSAQDVPLRIKTRLRMCLNVMQSVNFVMQTLSGKNFYSMEFQLSKERKMKGLWDKRLGGQKKR